MAGSRLRVLQCGPACLFGSGARAVPATPLGAAVILLSATCSGSGSVFVGLPVPVGCSVAGSACQVGAYSGVHTICAPYTSLHSAAQEPAVGLQLQRYHAVVAQRAGCQLSGFC